MKMKKARISVNQVVEWMGGPGSRLQFNFAGKTIQVLAHEHYPGEWSFCVSIVVSSICTVCIGWYYDHPGHHLVDSNDCFGDEVALWNEIAKHAREKQKKESKRNAT